MKLESMTVFFNPYDFTWEGVPAKGYGARAVFTSNNSKLDVKLDQDTVQQILKIIAPSVVETCSNFGATSEREVCAAMQDNLLEHDANELR